MNKINMAMILKNHFCTLKNTAGRFLIGDIVFHIIIPIAIAIAITLDVKVLSHDIFSILVNFGAITTALLMSAVIMVYEQKNKAYEKLSTERPDSSNYIALGNKLKVYTELCHNICYTILSSIIIVMLSIAGSFYNFDAKKPVYNYLFYFNSFISFLTILFFVSTTVTFLMVVKRFSIVIDQ